MIPEQLATRRLALRGFTQADNRAVFDYWNSDPNWAQLNASVPADYTETDAESFVAELIARGRKTRPTWAVTLGERVVGIVGLTFEQSHRVAVVGYRGRGE